MAQFPLARRQPQRALLAASIALLMVLLLSACGGNAQVQQKADQNKTNLDKALSHARSIGVPGTLLRSITDQEKKLSETSAPLSIFSNQPADDYHSNLSQRYQQLTVQLRGLETQTTQNYTYQASLDMQSFEDILGQRQSQGFVEASTFATKLAHDQTLMAQGQYPKQFQQISVDAKDATQALHLLGTTNDKYMSLQDAVTQLKNSNLDTTTLDQQIANDKTLFRTAHSATDFTKLGQQIDAQLQGTITLSAQAIPYVGQVQLQSLASDIATMKEVGIDATTFQKRLDADTVALKNAKSLTDYLKFSAQMDTDVASTRIPMMQANATQLVQQFHQEVKTWGDTHQWSGYRLDYEYDQAGIGSDLDAALQYAQTPDDYQGVIDLSHDDMFNLKLMEADANDGTPWSQSHATDVQALQHYHAMGAQGMMVSLIEQSLRLYQNGQLVKSFQITSGQYDKPSLPGKWSIIDRESPTVFKSGAPKGSAFWYPDTNINFAMGYHSGGYFFHDSWWRQDYGLHTNFPHVDSGGDQSFAGNGSHGCFNIQEDQANWLYHNTSYATIAIIY